MRYLFILIMLMSATCFALTDDSSSSKQKQIMQNFMQDILQHKNQLTALSMVAQCKDNPPILVYGGFTSINQKKPINEDSLFQVASITKSFITVVILQLAEEYKFNIDTQTLDKYFPEYPKWGKITVRQLLNMTSGIPGVDTSGPDDIFNKFTLSEYTHYISPKEILNRVYSLPCHFKPGTQWEYSNTNYILLGVLIQKITHHSAIAEVQKRIINRLALHHTYFPADKLQSMPGVDQTNIVHSYAFFSKDYQHHSFIKFGLDTTNYSYSEASYSGAIVSTPKDINEYLHALYKPGVLLTSSQLNEFMTLISRKDGKPFAPKKSLDDFGFGLGVFGYYSKSQNTLVYFYQGSREGSQFYYFYVPDTQLYLTFGVNSRSDVVGKQNTMALIDALNEQCKK